MIVLHRGKQALCPEQVIGFPDPFRCFCCERSLLSHADADKCNSVLYFYSGKFGQFFAHFLKGIALCSTLRVSDHTGCDLLCLCRPDFFQKATVSPALFCHQILNPELSYERTVHLHGKWSLHRDDLSATDPILFTECKTLHSRKNTDIKPLPQSLFLRIESQILAAGCQQDISLDLR